MGEITCIGNRVKLRYATVLFKAQQIMPQQVIAEVVK